MDSQSRHRNGFTLIELMIVVAIIGILAATALPNFLRFQLRSKSSEGKLNLAAIRTSQEGHYAVYGRYVPSPPTPAALPGATRTTWPAPSPGCPSCFDALGFAPEGPIWFQYEVVTSAAQDAFTAAAVADLDGDGARQIWGYVVQSPAGVGVASTLSGGAAAIPCPATGTWSFAVAANVVLSTVGPCSVDSGQSVH
jgi:type IV pilus assembly protein PilA